MARIQRTGWLSTDIMASRWLGGGAYFGLFVARGAEALGDPKFSFTENPKFSFTEKILRKIGRVNDPAERPARW